MAVLFSLLFASWSAALSAQVQCEPSLSLDCPPNITVQCTDLPLDPTTPGINLETCGTNYAITYSIADVTNPGTGCSYTITRTHTVIYGPITATCSQTITVIDNQGPVISGIPADVTVECGSEIPGPATATYSDACGTVTNSQLFVTSNRESDSSLTGYSRRCVLTTPQGPGPDGSIWLFNVQGLGLASSNFWSWVGTPSLNSYNDGTAHLVGDVVNNSNAAQGWHVDMWFKNKRNWSDWSALGRSYKDDLGFGAANYTNWDYYELADIFSTLTGTGAYAGNVLYLRHQPTNYYFGFQCGLGANNRNGNEGMSGWFYWDGWYNGQWRSGHGDLFTDKQCSDNRIECSYQVQYVYRAQDNCGNNSFASQTITVEDTEAPYFTNCPESVTIECDQPIPAALTTEEVGAMDACTGVENVVFSETSEAEGCTRVITRRYAAVDFCGNRSDCYQTITIVDTTPPVITTPADVTYECDEEVVLEDGTVVDNCNLFSVTIELDTLEGECPNSYVIIRTWTATDVCQNSSQASQTINIVDTTGPVFDQENTYVQVECGQVESVPAPTAQDNCGSTTVVLVDETLNSGGCLGVYQRTYVAYDDCGNASDSAYVFIAVLDNTPPVIYNPEDMTVECDQVPSAPEVEAVDNCGLEVTLTFEETREDGECADSYTIIWHWHAVDYCGNMSDAYTTITVIDNTDPVWTYVPEDMTILCSDEIPAVDLATADDNCDDNVEVEVTESTTPGECINEYTINRIFRAYDNCGNSIMAMQHIFVVDTVAPYFTFVPADTTIECNTDIPESIATAADLCQGEVTVTSSIYEEYSVECLTVLVREFVATDACGNTDYAYQTISIVDTTAPSFEGSEVEISLPCDDYAGTYVTVSDNCNEFELDYSDEFVSGGCTGRLIRTYYASDICGNQATFQQIITLIDEIAPTIASQTEDFIVECGIAYQIPTVTFEDNCDNELDLDSAYTEETLDCITYITYSFSAEDNCGNVTTAQVVVTIIDTVPPVVTTEAGGEFSCDEEINYGSAFAYDRCVGQVSVTYEDDTIPGECVNSYTIIRTWMASDLCGNTGYATSEYYVYDNQAPEFTLTPDDMTLECDQDIPTSEISAGDNCTVVPTITSVLDTVFISTCYKHITRTYTATDDCGNFNTYVQNFYFYDTTPPTIDGTIEISRPCGDFAGIYVETSDNCGEVDIWYNDEFVSGGCTGRYIRTYYAIDECQNLSEFQQIITLTDDIAPVVEDQPADFSVECNVAYVVPVVTFSDNCDEELDIDLATSEAVEGCRRIVTYTYTATDNCNNTTSASVVVTITDTTAPEIFTFGGGWYSCDAELINFGSATAQDNCDLEVQITHTDSREDGDCPNAYTNIRVFMAVDDCGNTSYDTVYTYIYDDAAPEFTSTPDDINVECSNDVPVTSALAEDNCGGATVTYQDYFFEDNCYGYYERIFTAEDDCGNTSTYTQIIDIVDTQAPVFTGSVEVTASCGNEVPVLVTATDACAGEVTVIIEDEQMVSGGCAGRLIRDYIAYDYCGNYSTFQQIITFTDSIAPMIEIEPQDVTIECGDQEPVFIPSWYDNCDGELTLTAISGIAILDSCTTVISQSWTATDDCNNSTTVSRSITIIDTTAPTWESEGFETTVECGTVLDWIEPYAYDACSNVTYRQSTSVEQGNCPANYTETITWIAVDACGNESEPLYYIIHHEDTEAPYVVEGIEGGQYSCEDELPMDEPTFDDACSAFTVSMSADTVAGNCPNSYIIVRSWVATDSCGNSSDAFVTSYYVYDNTPPVFSGSPADVYLECYPVNFEPLELTATDLCGTATVEHEVSYDTDDCGNGVIVVTYFAYDECDNMAEEQYVVYINDDSAPVLSEEPADIVLNCDQQIPDAPVVTATDNCTQNVEVVYSADTVGDALPQGAVRRCRLITPDITQSGPCQTYYNNTSWALWLGSMPQLHRYFSVSSGTLTQWANGSLTLDAWFTNATNPALGGFHATVTFDSPKDWATWSTQPFPTSFKADCGALDDNHPSWIYYLLKNTSGSELVGYGAYAGSTLNLLHAPANKYFGFQLGDGANNLTPGYGLGGWFTYSGTIMITIDNNTYPLMSGTAGGAGDFAINLDCCPNTVITRCWTAFDCSGNEVSHCQTIRYEGTGDIQIPQITANNNNVVRESNVQITSLFPNPAADQAEVRILSTVKTKVNVDVIDMTGRKVGAIYTGDVDANITYRFTINSGSLTNGIYQVRVSSTDGSFSTRNLNIIR
jgi:hypothetical protein